MPRDAFIAHLNNYFDCVAGAAIAAGGEVLDFIGDAVLAIFPLDNGLNPEAGVKSTADCNEVVRNATAAVAEAMSRADIACMERQRTGLPNLEFGIALSIGEVMDVRGFSFFGDSYVYVVFEDGTDLYWARSRVLEYLAQVQSRLPSGASPELGPDATGVGWIFQYVLIDRTGNHDLAQLRTLQDWWLKYELQTIDGVSEVATIGGMVKQYQVVVDPNKLRAFGIPLPKVREAIDASNRETGGSVIEMGEAEYMLPNMFAPP